MALQVRRGTNAERLGITPLAGELVYTTDTKQLYVGDGSTAGGITSISGTIDSVLADTTPQLGGTLDLNGNDITGAGNININGTITATGNINLGDGAGSDVISVGGSLAGHLLPSEDTTWNLGALTYQFKEAWISQLNVENQITAGRINANLIADDSTVVFDATTGLLTAAQLTGTATINVVGNTAGYHTGDVTGSVFGDDSTLLVDGVSSQIVGDVNNTQITTTFVNINQDVLDGSGITFNNITAGSNGGNFNFRASRTSLASPTVLEAGDISIDLAASGWDGTTYSPSAVIKLGTDKYTSSIGSGVMPGRILFLTYNELGATGVDNVMVLNRFGNLGIATDAPTEKLDVVGNIKASGFIQFGSLDTTARNALTAVNGMVIYNTTNNKFEGYQNGGWINLDDGTAAAS